MTRKSRKSRKGKTSQTTQRNGNTGSDSLRFRRYAFTLNNYTEEELIKLTHLCQLEKGILAREVGEQGTPHLQGYIEFKSQKALNALKKINNRVHWESAMSGRIENIIYCSKDGDVVYNAWPLWNRNLQILENEYRDIVWRPFQRFILNTLEEEPDHRKIYWVYEHKGNVGKSFLTRYLCLKDNYLICDGNVRDTACMIKEWYEKNPHKELKGILMDIPRCEIFNVRYDLIEKVKNGIMFSGKYQSGQIILPRLHIICFANDPPNVEELSIDRWKIYEIQEDFDVDFVDVEDVMKDENKDDDDILFL